MIVLVIPLTQVVTVHEVGGWVHEEVDGRASSVARESGGERSTTARVTSQI